MRDQWPEFCRKFATDLRGSLITVKQNQRQWNTGSRSGRRPLEEFDFAARAGECSDLLHIKAGGVEHQVYEPIRMLLRDGMNDRYNRLEIFAENGTTVLKFNPRLPQNF